MPETVDATEVDAPKEHYAARLKREHGEQAEEIKRLKARIEELESGGAVTAPPVLHMEAPKASSTITPETFVPVCVASLLAGGVKPTDLMPMVQAAYASSLALIEAMNAPESPVKKSIETRSERQRLQAEWDEKDKQAQGESMQMRIKRDGAARSTSQMEKERLTQEVAGHQSRMNALIAECLMIEAKIKALG